MVDVKLSKHSWQEYSDRCQKIFAKNVHSYSAQNQNPIPYKFR